MPAITTNHTSKEWVYHIDNRELQHRTIRRVVQALLFGGIVWFTIATFEYGFGRLDELTRTLLGASALIAAIIWSIPQCTLRLQLWSRRFFALSDGRNVQQIVDKKDLFQITVRIQRRKE